MNVARFDALHAQLLSRQRALTQTIAEVGPARDLARLLVQVDQALERFQTDIYGQCLACDGFLSEQELAEQPMSQYCLCNLTPQQQQALQRDLDLAWKIQASLLPPPEVHQVGWQVHHRFQPAGPVSGDYCDVVTPPGNEWLYFLVGDVSGKGVAASYLMAHVSALVRRTLDEAVPVSELIRIVNRHLTERSPATHFVTLICGRAHRDGRVEICNAGHCMPLLARDKSVERLASSGLPTGILAEGSYTSHTTELSPGDSLLLYTDGLSEAMNVRQDLYGDQSLIRLLRERHGEPPKQLVAACLEDVARFRGAAPVTDDLTLMILRRK